MAYWTGTTIKYLPPESYPNYPTWSLIDCGCCLGLRWGGDYPRECSRCGGSGRLVRHNNTRVLADYPGGPFRGYE